MSFYVCEREGGFVPLCRFFSTYIERFFLVNLGDICKIPFKKFSRILGRLFENPSGLNENSFAKLKLYYR